EYGVKTNRISTILISHLHGDHIYGLPGLLTSYNLFNRIDPLRIIGPEGIREYVELTMQITNHSFTYPIEFQELRHAGTRTILDTKHHHSSAFPLSHRIPTSGYKVTENIARTELSKDKVVELGLTDQQIQNILTG